MKTLRNFAVAAILAGSLPVCLAEQPGTWTGKGPNLNWSTGANWFGNTPPNSTRKVYFEDFFESGWTNNLGLVNNVVDANISIGTLYYTAFSTKANGGHYYTTLINPGATLTVGGFFGSSAPTMAVGDIPGTGFWTASGQTNYTQIRGAGTLLVNDTLGRIYVGGSGTAPACTWLDMTNLNTFTANVGTFYVAVNLDNPNGSSAIGNVFLARTNTITTTSDGGVAPGFLLGAANGAPGEGNFGTIVLGAQNTFNSDAFVVGGSFAGFNALTFTNLQSSLGTPIGVSLAARFSQNIGSFKLRASDGVSRVSTFSIADSAARPGTMNAGVVGNGSASGFVDLRQGTADILADKIYIGHGSTDGDGSVRTIATANGTLVYEQGNVDVNNLYLGYKQGTNNSQGIGVLVMQSNATMTVNNNLYMGLVPDQATNYGIVVANGTNIVADNAVQNIGGNIQFNDGAFVKTNAAATVSLRGGLINMFNNGAVTVYNLDGFGTISNASSITVSNMLNPGLQGNGNVGTLNLYSNVTILGQFPISFDIGTATNEGAPFNDLINIRGSVSFNSNAVNLYYVTPPSVGKYRLIEYTGSKSGVLMFTNYTRSSVSLDQTTPGVIQLVISSLSPGNLTWNGFVGGTNPPVWAVADTLLLTNWGAPTAVFTNWGKPTNLAYLQFDNVVFDDSVTNIAGNPVYTNLCFPIGLLYPNSIYVTNNSLLQITNRTFGISSFNGAIRGTTGLTKDGAGQLAWGVGQATNTFTGDVHINNGSVAVYDPSTIAQDGRYRAMLGFGSIFVTNGATLDFTKISGLGVGNALYLSGGGNVGYTNTFSGSDGAIFANNTVGHTLRARLTGNTTISTWLGNVGFAGNYTPGASLASAIPNFPIFQGELSLNGYNLTVQGTNTRAFFLVDATANTAGGNILMEASELRLVRSSISGGGNIIFTNMGVLDFAVNSAPTNSVVMNNIIGTNLVIMVETNVTGPGAAIPTGTNKITGSVAVDMSAPVTGLLTPGLYVSNVLQALEIDGQISGSAQLTKVGNGPLILNTNNSYLGDTFVNGGALVLGPFGTIPSATVTLNPSVTTLQFPPFGVYTTTFDVTAVAPYALGSGKTLALNGVVPADVLVQGNVTLNSGSVLFGAGTFNGNLTAASGSEIAPGGTNNQGQIVVNGNLNLNGAHLTWDVTPSFATSDGIVVNGNLNLSGVNTFTIDSIGGFAPNGTNTLITFTGTRTGGLPNLAINNPNVRFVLSFVDPATTPGKIQVILTVPPGNLVWKGADSVHPTYWDIKTTTNWINALTNDIFASADFVTFDPTGASKLVDVGGAGTTTKPMTPGSMTVSNAAYVLQGPNGIITSSLLLTNAATAVITNNGDNQMVGIGTYVSGDSTLSMRQTNNQSLFSDLQGSGSFDKSFGAKTLKLVGNASSNWNGTISVNKGQLSVGQDDAIAGPVGVASGATLDIGGHAINAATVTAAGVGFDGLGAINNRLFVETNITDWNSNVVKNLILSGDTTIGAISNAWGIQGLTGGGNNLTKISPNDIWIATGTDTGLGNVTVVQGRLFFEGNGTGLGDTTKSIFVSNNATLGFAATNYTVPGALQNPQLIPAFAATYKSLFFASGSQFSPTILLILGPGSAGSAGTNVFTGPLSFTNNLNFIAEGSQNVAYFGNISSPAANNGTLILSNNQASAGFHISLFGTNTYASNTWLQGAWLTISNMVNLPTNSLLMLSNANGLGFPSVSDTRLFLFGNNMFTNRALALSATNAPIVVSGSGQWWGNLYMHGSKGYPVPSGLGPPMLARAFTFNASSGPGLDLAFTNIDTTTRVMAPVAFGGNNIRLRSSMNLWVTPSVQASSGSAEFGAVLDPDPEFPGIPPQFQIQLDSTNNWYFLQFDTGRINWNTNNVLPPGGLLNVPDSGTNCLMDLHGFNQTISQFADTNGLTATNAFFNDSTTSDSTLTIGGPSYTTAFGASPNLYTNSTTVVLSASTNTVSHHLLHLIVTGGLTQLLNTNNYDGLTTVSGGKFLLGNYTETNSTTAYSGMLQGTPSVTVSGTGIFGGNGFVGAPVIVNAGGTILPGECLEKLTINPPDAPAVLTRTGPLTFGGTSLTLNPGATTWFNVDNGINPITGSGTNATIVGLSSVSYAGTLIVSNISAVAFTNNQVVNLFDAVPGNYSGSFSTIKVWGATSFDASKLTVDGTIKILVATATTPVRITKNQPNKNILTLSWPADHIGWRLQIMTNTTVNGLVQGGTNYVQTTNWVNCDGATTFSSTNLAIGNTNVVFRLIYP
jgi:autotransporter-associated beta strand protein